MKVKDIYVNMLALTLETENDNTEYEEFVVPHFNLLLQELHYYNNVARKMNGKDTLPKTARVNSLDDENPFEWQLDVALAYGLAAKLLTAGEHGLEGVYQQMYYAALSNAFPVQSESVVDVYAADCD